MVTGATVAVNPALVALAGTIRVAGNETALLLLERLTLIPPLGAPELSVTVKASVAEPVTDALLQEREVKEGVAVVAGFPVSPLPCNFTVVVGFDEVLVKMLNCAVESVLDLGL